MVAEVSLLPFQADQVVSELMVARRFALEFGGTMAFCHSRGGWYEFDGAVWKFQETPVAFHYTRELAARIAMDAKNAPALQKSAFCRGVESFARADPVFSRTASDWDTDLWLLGTPGGTVDLRLGEIRPARASDNITKSTLVEPDEVANCPTWEAFLQEATGNDDELIRFLQQICGYALTGDISEQMLFFIFGPGGNGKGVFLSAIQNIMGDYSVVAPMEALEKQKFAAHTTDLAMMQGARLVSASETEQGAEWNDKRIKALTGGDKITARFMNRNNTTFTPQLTLVVIGNHKPTLRSVDDSIRRRFNMIPFTIKPKSVDRRLADKLQLEWSSILRWMIDGCLDWQKNGFVRPTSVAVATEKYFEEQDIMADWQATTFDVDVTNEHWSESASALFKSWSKFATENGVEAGSVRTFAPVMKGLGFTSKRLTSGMVYRGLRFKSATFSAREDDPFERH